jgi:cytidyltransferase-like protein
MAVLGSPNYRVGLIIARAQPFHNGHLKIITDALMVCDEVIISFRDYNTSFFDYNDNQKLIRNLLENNTKISFFGTEADATLGTPKHVIERTLDKLEEGRYNMPTHFFTNYDIWVEPAKELQLETVRVSTLAGHNSDEIFQSVLDGTDYWKDKVPYSLLEDIETMIATKNRNF